MGGDSSTPSTNARQYYLVPLSVPKRAKIQDIALEMPIFDKNGWSTDVPLQGICPASKILPNKKISTIRTIPNHRTSLSYKIFQNKSICPCPSQKFHHVSINPFRDFTGCKININPGVWAYVNLLGPKRSL